MARYSKERQKEHIARIRRILVMKSDASILEIRDALIKSKRPLKLDKDYINKLVNKIRKERAYRYDYYTLNKVLAGFEDKLKETELKLWYIINRPDATHADKIAAIREIRKSNKELFEKMFDAGIFERQLGKMKVMTQADVLKAIQDHNVDTTADKNNSASG